MSRVGVIGGSGLYKMEGVEVVESVSIFTPFGAPSCNFVIGKIDGVEFVFLPRHGKGHRISPSEINYRANIFGMKKLGVKAILSVSACGSLKESIKPLDFVVPEQFVDNTRQRISTFFGQGIVAHVPLAVPVDIELNKILVGSAKQLGITVHNGGTYLCMEGPQFSTKAESKIYRQWGLDIIGMTNATEAKLAREAEIAYATLAAVTDYDCWYETEESVTVEMIIDNLNKNVANAQKILRRAIPQVAKIEHFSAEDALKYAIITRPEEMSKDRMNELDFLIGKYLK
jgi:5'-methylthioadenosine phosphorylase